MRQKFDVGDLVYCRINQDWACPPGIIIQKSLINANMLKPEEWIWHVDEYRCRVRFTDGEDIWLRAKWLEHVDEEKEENDRPVSRPSRTPTTEKRQ